MGEKKDLLRELKEFPMLQNLPDHDLGCLAELMKEEIFEEGSRIIEEGAVGDNMYLLLKGTVEVLKTTLYGDEYVCATLTDELRCVFGEMALIDHDRRSATVKAKTVCRTLSITASDFQKYCRDYPSVGCELLHFIAVNLCRNLRKENENLLKVYQTLLEEIEAM